MLIVAPWSAFWEHNHFAETSRIVESLVNSSFVRGAVTGIGLMTVLAGLAEVASLIRWRRHEPAGPSQAGQ